MYKLVINKRCPSIQSRNIANHLKNWRYNIALEIKKILPDEFKNINKPKKIIRRFAKKYLSNNIKLYTEFFIQNKNLVIDLDNMNYFIILIFKTIPTFSTIKYFFYDRKLNDWLYFSTYKISSKTNLIEQHCEKFLGAKHDKTSIEWHIA